ncbi:MAG: deoxyguanosinetriphosphate triphosphohydrolase [Deltaproteobacteria bacterium]|nr:deoxyguanosinetriphosphate triphosphohydrolase [Deltaproteobacteria bacterium]
MRTREDFEKEEQERLAPYAVKSGESLGRLIPEEEDLYRSRFQRDRDRILHSRAFRRLEYKTQVFVYHEGDHYRNRLTHTLEGAQIGRSIARALRLNEDLTEAILLAHDLGHTPFGHAGERSLRGLMREHGGFDHNRQSIRVVDLLEERFPGHCGLNLTSETREGMLKHGSNWEHPLELPTLKKQLPLEAQLADISDEIAYMNHDLDDGLRSGLLTMDQLESVPLWCRAQKVALRSSSNGYSESVLRTRTIASLVNLLVTDLIENTGEVLQNAGLTSLDEIRGHATGLVGFSETIQSEKTQLRSFLYKELYSHFRVVRMSRKAGRILKDLFEIYLSDTAQLPPHVLRRTEEDGEQRAVADYIAGMTDRFALADHRKLLDPHEPV